MNTKKCNGCEKRLPINFFGINNANPDGLSNFCRTCRKNQREALRPLPPVRKTNFIEGEIWRPAVGFEGYYEVSSIGRMRSVDRMIDWEGGEPLFRRGMLMINNPIQKKKRYFKHTLCMDKKRFCKMVHVMVALAFIPNPLQKPFINHKDGDKHNNRIENLEWCTSSENTQHAIATGLLNCLGENSCFAKATNYQVKEVRELFKTHQFLTNGQFYKFHAERLGLHIDTIRKWISGAIFQIKEF